MEIDFIINTKSIGILYGIDEMYNMIEVKNDDIF